jgi:cation-transporting ATPase 13A3/4/5
MTPPPAHRDEMPHPEDGVAEEEDATLPSHSTSANGSLLNGVQGNGPSQIKKKAKGPLLEQVRYIDYRYYRFLLHPDGEFRMVR